MVSTLNHLFYGIRDLADREAKVMHNYNSKIMFTQVVHDLKVRLPITDILIINPVDEILLQDEKRDVNDWILMDEGWDKILLMNIRSVRSDLNST